MSGEENKYDVPIFFNCILTDCWAKDFLHMLFVVCKIHQPFLNFDCAGRNYAGLMEFGVCHSN